MLKYHVTVFLWLCLSFHSRKVVSICQMFWILVAVSFSISLETRDSYLSPCPCSGVFAFFFPRPAIVDHPLGWDLGTLISSSIQKKSQSEVCRLIPVVSALWQETTGTLKANWAAVLEQPQLQRRSPLTNSGRKREENRLTVAEPDGFCDDAASLPWFALPWTADGLTDE